MKKIIEKIKSFLGVDKIKPEDETLKVLRSIDAHLAKLSSCVKLDHHRHGDRASLSTKHWNG